MKRRNDELILKTLLYSDLFDYPLKISEVRSNLLGNESRGLSKRLEEINSVVYRKKGYLYLKGREKLVNKRIRREKISEEKIKKIRRKIELIALFPTVLLIGISGSLSVKNSQKTDDIDLFIVTKKDTVWTTRLILVLILKFLGLHRSKGEKNTTDKFCMNMLADEKSMSLPNKLRNLYTAHEVIQFLPLAERENTYKKFIRSNYWAFDFLPNSFDIVSERKVKKIENGLYSIFSFLIKLFLLERITKAIQMISIKRGMTKETIGRGFMAFHPKGAGEHIISKYRQKLIEYNLYV